MPVDPICGIELENELAIIHNHKSRTYYFCCEGCKRIFIRKPRKYSKWYRIEITIGLEIVNCNIKLKDDYIKPKDKKKWSELIAWIASN
jgi:YHS domain-containing protein